MINRLFAVGGFGCAATLDRSGLEWCSATGWKRLQINYG